MVSCLWDRRGIISGGVNRRVCFYKNLFHTLNVKYNIIVYTCYTILQEKIENLYSTSRGTQPCHGVLSTE